MTFCLTSCFKERIELDLNDQENQKLVVEAWINNLDEQQEIILSLTSNYFDSFEPTYVDDAIVTLSYTTEEYTLQPIGSGVYTMPENWRAEESTTYTLDIDYNNTLYTSTSVMRIMPDAYNIRQVQYNDITDSIALYDIYFDFVENPGEGDGYYGIDYKKGSADGDTLTNGEYINDDFIDGIEFKDATVTDEGYEIGDTVVLELYSIGIEATNFLLDIETEVFREGIFAPPPVNVRSNISNGAVGYFITSGAQRYELMIE